MVKPMRSHTRLTVCENGLVRLNRSRGKKPTHVSVGETVRAGIHDSANERRNFCGGTFVNVIVIGPKPGNTYAATASAVTDVTDTAGPRYLAASRYQKRGRPADVRRRECVSPCARQPSSRVVPLACGNRTRRDPGPRRTFPTGTQEWRAGV